MTKPSHKWKGQRLRGFVLSVLVILPGGLAAQTPSGPGPEQSAPRIIVGEVIASPGESLMVPVYFAPAPHAPLRAFALEIEYVSNNLKFQKAAAGPPLERAGGRVEAALSEGARDDKGVNRSQLRLSVSVAPSPADGLPKGLLAYLLFQLSVEAKPFVIRLNAEAISATGLHEVPGEAAQLQTDSGSVTVEMGEMVPATACFFFTH